MKSHIVTLVIASTIIAACAETEDEVVAELSEDLDPAVITELVAEDVWENGLEELLDPVCTPAGCRWVWTSLEDDIEQEVIEILPDVPQELLDEPLTSATDIAPKPSAACRTLVLQSLQCLDMQETFSDEPYLRVNGNNVWFGTGFALNTSKPVNVSVQFCNSASVELLEDDGLYDDSIALQAIANTLTAGTTRDFVGAGAKYRLWYKVI